MKLDLISIGSSPTDEPCAQVGSPFYFERAQAECRAFKTQIVRELGTPPVGATLRVKSFIHDFGSYFEVVCYFDPDDQAAVEYAFKCESDSPANWDEISRAELKSKKYL